MTNTAANAIYNKELEASRAYVNTAFLVGAIALCGEEVVSVDHSGYNLSFIQEIAEVGRITNTAYARETVNYYRHYVAESVVDGSKTAKTAYIRAAKKIIYLNTVCKKQFGLNGFIVQKIDLADIEAVKALVDSFDFALRHKGR